MGAAVLPLVLFTVIFAIIGCLLPIFVPKNPYRGVVQVSLILTGATLFFFWVYCYMAQMNPLIGPILHQRTLIAVKEYWGEGWQDDA